MKSEAVQSIGLVWRHFEQPFRLRANDVVRIDGRLGRVIRVTESAAVVLVNRPARRFKTRFDRPVHFQPAPVVVRIAADSEIEILNRNNRKPCRTGRRPA
jgi:hypothetical protein